MILIDVYFKNYLFSLSLSLSSARPNIEQISQPQFGIENEQM